MAAVADPVAAGLITSLARPGGNITGISNQLDTISGKHLELLKELNPALERVGIVYSRRNRSSVEAMSAQRDRVAPQLGLTALPFAVDEPGDIEKLFAALLREKPQALSLHATPIISAHRKEIAAFAIEQRLPTIIGLKVLVPDGFLMSYAHDPVATWRRVAWYVDQILAGANPGELPVERTHEVELLINLRTARAIGIQIPPFLVSRADEVIE
jgi:putative ABC transport system substrate-binding protein